MTRFILIIRHAEKPTALDQGLDERGFVTEAGLSVRGWQRAGALVRYFSSPASSGAYARPAALYAARDSEQSTRPLLTVQPLAAALALPVVGQYESGRDETALMEHVLAEERPALICWRHDWIPALVRPLVGTAPRAWPEDVYDETWVLSRQPDKPWTLTVARQGLLAGDRP